MIIPTYNEEVNLPHTLPSVSFADEVVVLDSYSTDRTVEMARQFGCRVQQRPFDDYARHKNWALDHLPLSHEWVLILDADEMVTPELAHELEERLSSAEADGLAGYYVNRRLIFMSCWIRHCGWYPSWNLRFFRHRLGRYEERAVHEHVILDGPVGYLKHDLIHHDRKGLEAFIARHNRYSSLEARARLAARSGQPTGLGESLFRDPVKRKRALRLQVASRLPFPPLWVFLYMYFVRLGFLDGRAGLQFCLFHFFQEWMVGLKMRELEREGGP